MSQHCNTFFDALSRAMWAEAQSACDDKDPYEEYERISERVARWLVIEAMSPTETEESMRRYKELKHERRNNGLKESQYGGLGLGPVHKGTGDDED